MSDTNVGIHTPQSPATRRLIPGQTVLLPWGAFATVLAADTFSVRVTTPGGPTSRYAPYEVRTRAEALYSAYQRIVRVAEDLGDLELMDAAHQMAEVVVRAAHQADAADAVAPLTGGVA